MEKIVKHLEFAIQLGREIIVGMVLLIFATIFIKLAWAGINLIF